MTTSKLSKELSELRRRKIAEGLESAKYELALARYDRGLSCLDGVASIAAEEGTEVPELPGLVRTMREGYMGSNLAQVQRIMMTGRSGTTYMNFYEKGLQILRSLERSYRKWSMPVPEERVAELKRIGVQTLLATADELIQKGSNLHIALTRLDKAEQYGSSLGVDVSAVDELRRQLYDVGIRNYLRDAVIALAKMKEYASVIGSTLAEGAASGAISLLEELVRAE